MMPDDTSPLLFLSYSHSNSEAAKYLAEGLKRQGVKVRLDSWSLSPGDDFVAKMTSTQRVAGTILVLLGSEGLERNFSRGEWLACISRKNPPIAVKVAECDIENYLGAVAYLDLANLPRDNWATEILHRLKRYSRSSESSSRFPGHPRPERESLKSGEAVHTRGDSVSHIWHVPSVAYDFVGRNELLKELHEVLRRSVDKSTSAITVQSLTGPDRIGASALAAEYARVHRRDFDVVWWIRAGAPASLARDLAQLADAVGASSRVDDWGTVRRKLKAWGETTDRRWLFVFDNVDAPEDFLDIVPERGEGRILFTSRTRPESDRIESLDIGVFDLETATRYLLERTGSKDRKGAMALASNLDGLAVAMEYAAAYVRVTGIDFKRYMSRLDDAREERHRAGGLLKSELTVGLAIDEAAKLRAETVKTLQFVAFMAGEKVQPRVVEFLTRDSRIQETIRVLVRFSLIDITPDGDIQCVQPVQSFMRRSMTAHTRAEVTNSILNWLTTALPKYTFGSTSWIQIGSIVPHALALIEHAELNKSNASRLALIYHRLGRYSHLQGDSTTAARLLARASSALSLVESHDDQFRRILLNDASVVHAELGDGVQALDLAAEVLQLDLENRGGHKIDSKSVPLLSNLAGILADTGMQEEAQNAYLLALNSTVRDDLGSDETLVTIQHNYAASLAESGKLAEAIDVLAQVVAISAELFGETHADTVLSTILYAECLGLVGQIDKARTLMQAVVKTAKSGISSDPVDLMAMDGMALIHSVAGEWIEAISWAQGAAVARWESQGEHHPQTIDSLEALAMVFWRVDRPVEAYELMQKVVTMRSQVQGFDHLKTSNSSRLKMWMSHRLNTRQRVTSLTRTISVEPDHPVR